MEEELDLMIQLNMAFNSSPLPEHPDPNPFDKNLKKVRLNTLREYLKEK